MKLIGNAKNSELSLDLNLQLSGSAGKKSRIKDDMNC